MFTFTSRELINDQGVVSQSYQYAPFGQQLQYKKPSNLKNSNAFVGGIQDAGDLVYLKQRHYNPVLGRFYQPDLVTFIMKGHGQTNRYQYGWNDTYHFSDSNGLEPTQAQSSDLFGFINGLNTSPSKVGLLFGSQASDKLLNWGKSDLVNFNIVPREAWLNVQPFRYIYSEKVGWLDMQHFMFYAGTAYAYRNAGTSSEYALMAANNKGFSQEYWLDLIAARHSRFSYEDLVSNYMGAYFGAYAFNPKSSLSLSQQLNTYLGTLNIISPSFAPNFAKMPKNDVEILRNGSPTQTNRTTIPMNIGR